MSHHLSRFVSSESGGGGGGNSYVEVIGLPASDPNNPGFCSFFCFVLFQLASTNSSSSHLFKQIAPKKSCNRNRTFENFHVRFLRRTGFKNVEPTIFKYNNVSKVCKLQLTSKDIKIRLAKKLKGWIFDQSGMQLRYYLFFEFWKVYQKNSWWFCSRR